jgi:predicted dehydrogenase
VPMRRSRFSRHATNFDAALKEGFAVSSYDKQSGWLFKLKKVARYVKLYGLSRTWVKIRAHRHLKSGNLFTGLRWTNPHCRQPNTPNRNVALIGCGSFAFANIAYYLSKRNVDFLRVTYDVERSRSLSLCKRYGGAYVVDDWHEILLDPLVRGVFIATNHASHADYAVACIKAGKHVHIEKPHVVSKSQLDLLLAAMRQRPDVKVFLGFNRPRSNLFQTLRDNLKNETGSLMINWFIVGHEIKDSHWYYDAKEGGRVLGNLVHWTDLTLHLVTIEKAFPCVIVPASPSGSKSDFIVCITFADNSCAAITFSAKGETFEGVREVLNLQKGSVLANLINFESLTIDVNDKKIKLQPFYRDHGHEANILHSLQCLENDDAVGESIQYISATAQFFLTVKDAIETGATLTLTREQACGGAL